jgi:hypothetical protein
MMASVATTELSSSITNTLTLALRPLMLASRLFCSILHFRQEFLGAFRVYDDMYGHGIETTPSGHGVSVSCVTLGPNERLEISEGCPLDFSPDLAYASTSRATMFGLFLFWLVVVGILYLFAPGFASIVAISSFVSFFVLDYQDRSGDCSRCHNRCCCCKSK